MRFGENITGTKRLGSPSDSAKSVTIDYEKNGLASLRQFKNVVPQTRPHSHNEIELMLLEEGSGTWLMGGDVLQLKAGQLYAFWALKPHQLITCKEGTIINWLTLPLAVFTEWQLPGSFSKSILAGEVMIEPDKSWFESDKKFFLHWHADIASPDAGRVKLALLEIEARLARLAARCEPEAQPKKKSAGSSSGLMSSFYFGKISQIADFVSKNFSESITAPEIAKAIDMHPKAATKIFKKITGLNLMHYLAQYRIIHAQRMLVSTDMKIIDISMESGYHSVSRFYAAFKKFCGVSPQDFRRFSSKGKPPWDSREGIWRAEASKVPAEIQRKLARR